MDENKTEELAEQMGLELPGHADRKKHLLPILNGLDQSAWMTQFMEKQRRRIIDVFDYTLPVNPEAVARMFRQRDVLWQYHMNIRLHFVEWANRCRNAELDPKTQVRYLEGLVQRLKLVHKADETVLEFVEGAFLCFNDQIKSADMCLYNARWRRDRLWDVSKIIAEIPWAAVYFKGYLWEASESAFLERTEDNQAVEAIARANCPDCGICRDALTFDPSLVDPNKADDEAEPIPIDDDVLEVTRFVCATCRTPVHGHCALSWFAEQDEMRDEAARAEEPPPADPRLGCSLCRSPVEHAVIIAKYRAEIARMRSWGDSLARRNGKPTA